MKDGFFKQKSTWLFDLDNTLYSPKLGIFSQIDQRMKEFISDKLNLTEANAFKLQKEFYRKYGTTLYGLMKYHNVCPDEFCSFVHDIDFSNLKKSKILSNKIKLLKGQKFIYTNGDYEYAVKILDSLGITENFSDIFDIKKANYFPKPMEVSLNELLRKYGFKPEKTVYFDDLDKNLKLAFSKGITTIHITEEFKIKKNSYIDFRFKTIINALDMIIKV